MYLLIIDNILTCQQIQIINVSTLIDSSSVYVKNNDKYNKNKNKFKIEWSSEVKHARSNY